MAVFTFSTKPTKHLDTAIVERIKQHCYDHGLNFSAVVIQLLTEWDKEHVRQIQSN